MPFTDVSIRELSSIPVLGEKHGEQDVIQITRDLLDAFNANDLDGFGALLTDNAVYNEAGMQRILNGRDEIVEAMRG